MAKKQKRFVVIHEQTSGFNVSCIILQDTETNVQYLMMGGCGIGGVTPLLSTDGTPVIGKPLPRED